MPDEDRFMDSQDSGAEEFGPYLVYERIGIGGMATVHRAKKRGIGGFERGVAVKRMLPHLSDDAEFIRSFVHEANLASLLVHPNIAQIYDFGLIGNVYYIAMEHVDGPDINKLLRYSHHCNALPPVNVVLSILSELCEALEYAHTFVDEHGQSQSIVHRDVSPSNLIVAHTGHLKVIDFGIAKATSRPHTERRVVKGKFGYMSPEAVEARPVGPRSDVFSVGVVAHELLTAQSLFSARSEIETLHRLREAEILPPSHRNPHVPATLDRVVLAALERDEEHRLQSAGAFRQALEQLAIEAGIRLSSSAVTEWCARAATVRHHGRSRESPPTISRSAAMRGFSHALSASSLSHTHAPAAAELSGSHRPQSPSQQRHAGPLAESGAQALVAVGSVDGLSRESPSPVSAQNLASRPASPRSRSRTVAIIAMGALCTTAGGLALYQLAVRPTGAVAPPRPASPTSVPRPTIVKFIVRPPDSTVEIGGREVSRHSPYEAPLERGVYSVAVSHSGYKRWASQITLQDPDSQTINVALEPAAAIGRVSSQPSGLVAQLDGKPLDHVTPAEFETSLGSHRLVIVGATGTWSQDFVAPTAGTYTFHAVLTPGKRAPTAVTTFGGHAYNAARVRAYATAREHGQRPDASDARASRRGRGPDHRASLRAFGREAAYQRGVTAQARRPARPDVAVGLRSTPASIEHATTGPGEHGDQAFGRDSVDPRR